MKDFKVLIEKKLLEGTFDIKPTQNKISLPIAFRIYRKMKANLKFDAIKVCDELLIDGHHRYIASVLAGVTIEHFPSSKNHNQICLNWKDVSIITTDYDNHNEIKYHNFNDASRNGRTLKEIESILSN